MPRTSSEYVCQQCGFKSVSFMGRCPNCGEWNSLVETLVSSENVKFPMSNFKLDQELEKLVFVKATHAERMKTGFGEFDRVLGGGIVPGSIVLVSGEPGIGKSTLLLETAIAVSREGREGQEGREGGEGQEGRDGKKPSKPSKSSQPAQPVLYVTGEESSQQVKIRADRVARGRLPENLYILAATNVDGAIAAAQKLDPSLIIIDSVQTLTTDDLTGAAGSLGQVRECSQRLQRFAKSTKTSIILVGHVTKEGAVAGPKTLEHLVDAVLSMEGDSVYSFRLLRSLKNRFGSTFEVGVFEMGDGGMVEITNPSKLFLSERQANRPGSVVCATIAGGRPIICEVQALASATAFGIPTRRVTGLDFNRVQVVIASLSRAASLPLGTMDIYANVAGGLKVWEPASDLAVAVAIYSAVLNKPVKSKVCAFGEVGLLGELRNIADEKNRLSEAKRLGFSEFVSPQRFKTVEAAVKFAVGQ